MLGATAIVALERPLAVDGGVDLPKKGELDDTEDGSVFVNQRKGNGAQR